MGLAQSSENLIPDCNMKEIVVVESEYECVAVVERLRRECKNSFPVLGMDCEWNYEETNSVALLQLATLNGFCALFRFCHSPHLPGVIKNLLMDEDIWKVGVGIENDISRLPTNAKGWVDLRQLKLLIQMYPTKESDEEYMGANGMQLSLAALAKRILGIELNKHYRGSNWRSERLSPGQIHYAAMDAFVGVLICYALVHQEGALRTYSVSSPIDILRIFKEVRYKQHQ